MRSREPNARSPGRSPGWPSCQSPGVEGPARQVCARPVAPTDACLLCWVKSKSAPWNRGSARVGLEREKHFRWGSGRSLFGFWRYFWKTSLHFLAPHPHRGPHRRVLAQGSDAPVRRPYPSQPQCCGLFPFREPGHRSDGCHLEWVCPGTSALGAGGREGLPTPPWVLSFPSILTSVTTMPVRQRTRGPSFVGCHTSGDTQPAVLEEPQ